MGKYREELSRPRCWKRSTAALLCALLLGGASTQGCSSSGGSGGPADASTPASDPGELVNTLASAFCGALRGCCDTASYKYDEALCLAQFKARQPWVNSEQTDKVVYDANAAQTCIEALKARVAKCSTDPVFPDQDPSDEEAIDVLCRGIQKGTVAAGQRCMYGVECAKPVRDGKVNCHAIDHEGDRICSQETTAKLGEACVQTLSSPPRGENAFCTDGAYCSANPGTCLPVKALGEACEPENPRIKNECGRGNYCSSQGCKPLPRQGESCVYLSAFQQSACADGFYCEGWKPSFTCKPVKSNGAECRVSEECQSISCEPESNSDGGSRSRCQAVTEPNIYLVSSKTCEFGPFIKL